MYTNISLPPSPNVVCLYVHVYSKFSGISFVLLKFQFFSNNTFEWYNLLRILYKRTCNYVSNSTNRDNKESNQFSYSTSATAKINAIISNIPRAPSVNYQIRKYISTLHYDNEKLLLNILFKIMSISFLGSIHERCLLHETFIYNDKSSIRLFQGPL